MADIALDALHAGPLQPEQGPRHALPAPLTKGPVVADVWIDDSLGFALLIHRRSDGLVSEELYHSVRNSNGDWLDCEHLGGAILGFDIEVPAAIEDALAGAPVAVVSESESLIYTGRSDAEEGYESARVVTVLFGGEVDLIEIEDLSPALTARDERFTMDVTSPLMLLVLLPGQKLRVSALRHEGSSLIKIGGAMEFFYPER
ncbi:hypothetical protein [Streptomyces peucetius]|uniref:Uncharacterized protein n=1 Tax=Streptomyces peucetius TaxID=1950 RepID=A0ABY6I9S0_STRPE|nr:hypothetical protein [Streptomyces peucetius]UYQ62704.1 hypothetical protein OGH68_15250 [Streptomyces peucetius]